MSAEIKKAIYAGSFDPVTNGHSYMIETAAGLFDELTIALGTNPEKSSTFNLETRLAMLESVCSQLPNVKIVSMPHVYLVDFARSCGAEYIVRGVRNEHDYLFERTMRNVNADMAGEISTVFFMPPRELADISSSFLKGLVGPDGWETKVAHYMSEQVAKIFIEHYTSGAGA